MVFLLIVLGGMLIFLSGIVSDLIEICERLSEWLKKIGVVVMLLGAIAGFVALVICLITASTTPEAVETAAAYIHF